MSEEDKCTTVQVFLTKDWSMAVVRPKVLQHGMEKKISPHDLTAIVLGFPSSRPSFPEIVDVELSCEMSKSISYFARCLKFPVKNVFRGMSLHDIYNSHNA